MWVLKNKSVNCNTTVWDNDPSFTKQVNTRKLFHRKKPEEFIAINADCIELSENIINAAAQLHKPSGCHLRETQNSPKGFMNLPLKIGFMPMTNFFKNLH